MISEPEKYLLENVIYQTIDRNSYKYVFPQYEFTGENGNRYYIDFAIVTESSKIAIELDGYNYHAEGVVSREKFSNDLERQNELVLKKWTVIRFSWDQVRTYKDKCCDKLRRAIISDKELHPNLKKFKLEPHLLQYEALNSLINARKKV